MLALKSVSDKDEIAEMTASDFDVVVSVTDDA